MNTLTNALQTVDSILGTGNPIPMKISYDLNDVDRQYLLKYIINTTTRSAFGEKTTVELSNETVREFVEVNTNNPIMNEGRLYFTVNDVLTVMEVKTFKRNLPNCVYFDVTD